MDVDIRLAAEDDLASICAFVSTEQELFLFAPAACYPLTIEQLQRTLKQRLHCSVMECQDRVIGFANFYDYRKGDYCFIGNVIIHPAYRGLGHGRRLTEHMMKVAFDQYGFRELRISVFAHNIPARRLYTTLGFQFYDSETRPSPDGGQVQLLHLSCDYPGYINGKNAACPSW